MKLVKERTRLDTRKFYFSQRVVNRWNRLPATVSFVVNSETVNAFKNAYYDRNYVKDMDIRKPMSLPVHQPTSTNTSK